MGVNLGLSLYAHTGSKFLEIVTLQFTQAYLSALWLCRSQRKCKSCGRYNVYVLKKNISKVLEK